MEKMALSGYWKCSLRVKNGNVELKKGSCWGILSNILEAKKNAQILLKTQKGV